MSAIVASLPDIPPAFWESLWLTIRLAFITTFVLVAVGLPFAHWLNRSRMPGIVFLETLVSMPLVLPPTVIGFYLLVLFSPQHAPGRLWHSITGHTLAFSFSGLVVGSVLYSLPFAIQPFQAAFRNVPEACVEAAKMEGASAWRVFRDIHIPLAWKGIMVGVLLSFTHTMGEFGIVLMLGGGIPGETKVASIALYDEMQKLNYPLAHEYAAALLIISFILVSAMSFLNRYGIYFARQGRGDHSVSEGL